MDNNANLPVMVKALLDPGAYPPAERPLEIGFSQTHVSWLFFTGQFVYKVKKPVNYGFLDFSSVEKRRFYCHEEVRLNRRFSPEVYLDVVEIQQSGDKYFMGAGNNTVDYAVKMKQLPEDRWLSGLLEKNQVTPDIMKQIASRIAGFHASAQTNDEITKFGSVETLRYNTEENFVQTRKFIGSTITRETYDIIHAYTEAFLDTHKTLFTQRQYEGYIRDCHGDLHKDQICVDNGIEFIDCIEFNERFRYSDVAADLAFLAMDMERVGRLELLQMLQGLLKRQGALFSA
jgi:aminoglycoside phosphotransferase family enzyme